MNYCTNCKHKSPRHYGLYCIHPSLGRDVVTGEIEAEHCFIMRDKDSANPNSKFFVNRGKCGPEGILFERKPKTRFELLKQMLCDILKLN